MTILGKPVVPIASTVEVSVNIMPKTPQVSSADFEKLRIVGKGGYGTVFQARSRINNEILALKVIPKPDTDKEMKFLRDEITIMKAIQSPFVCNMLHFFESNQNIYFALEFLSGGDLWTLMEKEQAFDESATMFYIAETTLGLEYLHENLILYRDLKPENVMIDKDGHVKLTDFGLSKMNLAKGDKTATICGTLVSMAPEIVKKLEYGYAVDLWALGVMMYDMLMGGPPFEGDSPKETRMNIIRGKVEMPKELSLEGRKLLKGLLTRNPEKRMTIQEVKASKFFEEICWKKMRAQEYDPPFLPNLVDDEDVTHFDSKLTCQKVVNSPRVSTYEKENVNPFEGFDMAENQYEN